MMRNNDNFTDFLTLNTSLSRLTSKDFENILACSSNICHEMCV